MKILQRLKDGANRATEKAQGAVEISKLNNQIADVEKEMQFHFMEMGRVFYEGYSEEDMTLAEKEMLKHCKTCDGLQEEIEQLRRRIAELKNEKLCKCGRTVELDANFCPSCGRSLKGEAPASARDEGRKPPAAAKFEDEDFGETKIYREPVVQDDDDFEFELAFDKEEAGAAAESLYDFPGATTGRSRKKKTSPMNGNAARRRSWSGNANVSWNWMNGSGSGKKTTTVRPRRLEHPSAIR